MKPRNTNPELLLPDGQPTRCTYYASFGINNLDECEANSTRVLTAAEMCSFFVYLTAYPKAVVGFRNSDGYICDTHYNLLKEIGAITQGH